MLRRYAMPFICMLLLVGAGVGQMFVIGIELEKGRCGTPVEVLARQVRDTHFSKECHHAARLEVWFGSTTAGVGLVAGVGGMALMRRDPD